LQNGLFLLMHLNAQICEFDLTRSNFKMQQV